MMKMKLPLPKPPIKSQNQQKNVVDLNKKLDAASKKFRQAIQKNDYQDAYKQILPAYKLVPNHPKILMDLAYTELRLQQFDQARHHYLKAIQASAGNVDTNIYDGMAEVSHFLKNQDELKKYGHLAVMSKKKLASNEVKIKEIIDPAPTLNPDQPSENIIAYSLFGALPRYCETSIINVDLAKEIYPEWTCRFYVDDSVPQEIQNRLSKKGAQVVKVSAEQAQFSGLFWRFLVMDDPNVNCFLIRDADSLVSYRERAAVDAWLQSRKWFHSMRDFYSHTELILAGMWGGFNGVFSDIQKHIKDYIQTGRYLTERVMDQHYLRYCIWPTLSQGLMTHDSQGFDDVGSPFPPYHQHTDFEDLSEFHVGMNEGSSQVSAEVTIPDVNVVAWTLVDEHQQQICCYTASVSKERKILVELPRRYAKRLQSGEWKLHMYATENTD